MFQDFRQESMHSDSLSSCDIFMYGSTLAIDESYIDENSSYKKQHTFFHADYRFLLQGAEFTMKKGCKIVQLKLYRISGYLFQRRY